MIEFVVFGINFGISVGAVSVVTFMLYVDRTGLMLPGLEAVLIHEAAHIILLCSFGFKPKKIRLGLGTVSIDCKYCLSQGKECVMLIAGPAVNMVMFLCFYMGYKNFADISLLNRALVMFWVGFMNILPIKGLDGGSVLSLILHRFFKMSVAAAFENAVSLIFCLFILAFGIYMFISSGNNPSLVIFAIYLLICSNKYSIFFNGKC